MAADIRLQNSDDNSSSADVPGAAFSQVTSAANQVITPNTVVVWKLDRLVRPTRDLLEIMAAIQSAGAGFRPALTPSGSP